MIPQKLPNDIHIPWETNSTQKQCIIISPFEQKSAAFLLQS